MEVQCDASGWFVVASHLTQKALGPVFCRIGPSFRSPPHAPRHVPSAHCATFALGWIWFPALRKERGTVGGEHTTWHLGGFSKRLQRLLMTVPKPGPSPKTSSQSALQLYLVTGLTPRQLGRGTRRVADGLPIAAHTHDHLGAVASPSRS